MNVLMISHAMGIALVVSMEKCLSLKNVDFVVPKQANFARGNIICVRNASGTD